MLSTFYLLRGESLRPLYSFGIKISLGIGAILNIPAAHLKPQLSQDPLWVTMLLLSQILPALGCLRKVFHRHEGNLKRVLITENLEVFVAEHWVSFWLTPRLLFNYFRKLHVWKSVLISLKYRMNTSTCEFHFTNRLKQPNVIDTLNDEEMTGCFAHVRL